MISILAAWIGLAGFLPSGSVTDVSVVPSAGSAEVRVGVTAPVTVREFMMEGPTRLVVDLVGATLGLPAADFLPIDRGGVRGLRVSQYESDIVRLVLELDRAASYRVESGSAEVRIVLEGGGAVAFEPWSSSAARVALAPPAPPAPSPAAPPAARQELRRITVQFTSTPIREVLFAFAEFSGRSIIPGAGVAGTVNAEIRNQPWDVALREILVSQGLSASEDPDTGILRVDNVESMNARETFEPLITRAYPISYTTAAELRGALEPLLSERGRLSVGNSSNTLVVMDVQRVQDAVEALIRELDVRTPMINISAKIIFLNRTDLNEFGVVYDLKDSQGNQLNRLTPGGRDANGDGIISLPSEQVPIGSNVVSLGGSSLAALGNANNRVAAPALTLLTSLLMGRHTLVSFIEALQSVNLSEVEATPQVSVLDNHEARILVGERTPIRVIDAQGGGIGGGGGAGGGAGGQVSSPLATVRLEETGIGLRVTPHVTQGNNIRLILRAERSSAEVADSDVGLIFRTQEAESQVLVQDGETVVIGGLTVTERAEVRSGIPGLMRLPLIGRLFRTSREQNIQRDLMILVTPTIQRPVGE